MSNTPYSDFIGAVRAEVKIRFGIPMPFVLGPLLSRVVREHHDTGGTAAECAEAVGRAFELTELPSYRASNLSKES